jgi:hypothetical protein
LANKFNDEPDGGEELRRIAHHQGIHAFLHDGCKSSTKLRLQPCR